MNNAQLPRLSKYEINHLVILLLSLCVQLVGDLAVISDFCDVK